MPMQGSLYRLLIISIITSSVLVPLKSMGQGANTVLETAKISAKFQQISCVNNLVFSLPAQPLAQSLAEFSRLVNQVIIFDPALVASLTGRKVRGEYCAEQAMTILLSALPVAAEYSGYGWVITPKTKPHETASAVVNLNRGEELLTEVLVIGRYSNSLRTALRAQASSTQHLEIINAENIGRFPSLNIAEAINRSPGVSVVRDRGEALFVSIRGLPTEFNLFSLNGLPLATNENVRTSEQYGRRFHYDILPAAMVGRAEIKKTMTAEDLDGGVGGAVNMQLPTPFSIGESQFTVELSQQTSDLRNSSDPSVIVSSSWLDSEENIGIYGALVMSKRRLRQDRALNFGWQYSDITDLPDEFYRSEFYDSIVATPGSVRPTLEMETRDRAGIHLSVASRWSGASALEFNYLDLNQLIDYNEYSVSADYELAALDTASLVWRNNLVVGGETFNGSVQIGRESAGINDRVQSLTAHYFNESNDWQYTVDAGVSKSISRNNNPIRRTRFRRDNDVAFSFYFPKSNGNALPDIDYKNIDLLSGQAFPGRRLEWRVNNTQDSVGVVNVSLETPLSVGAITTLKLGANYRARERNYARKDALITEGFVDQTFSGDYFSIFPLAQSSAETFLKGSGLPSQWLVPNEEKIWRDVSDSDIASSLLLEQNMRNQYRVAENVGAAFFMADVKWRDWQGNIGLRIVNSRQTSSGFVVDENENGNTATSTFPVSFSSGYSKSLPSLNFKNNLRENIVFRLSLASTLNRPNLQDLAPRLTLNSGDEHNAQGGNPYLMPMTAWEFDTGLEYYFADDSVVSVAGFYKKISAFIQNGTSTLVINQQPYTVFSKGNGGNARVQGLEFEHRSVFSTPEIVRGRFGFGANMTLLTTNARYFDGSNVIHDKLSDVADRLANIELFYETNRFNFRVNYSWRSDVLTQVGTYNYNTRNQKPFGTVDVHSAYQFNSWSEVFVEGVNITNSAEKTFVDDSEFAGYTLYGRTFIVGARIAL